MKNKKEMMNYILNHFTYSLLNSWNGVKGYALKVKVWDMGFNRKTQDFIFDALATKDYYEHMDDIVIDFQESLKERFHNNNLNLGFNGRSGGYLVLYRNRTNNYADQTYDEYEMEEMPDGDIKEVYDLLREFDKLKRIIKEECEHMAKNFKVTEVDVHYTKKEKVLAEI